MFRSSDLFRMVAVTSTFLCLFGDLRSAMAEETISQSKKKVPSSAVKSQVSPSQNATNDETTKSGAPAGTTPAASASTKPKWVDVSLFLAEPGTIQAAFPAGDVVILIPARWTGTFDDWKQTVKLVSTTALPTVNISSIPATSNSEAFSKIEITGAPDGIIVEYQLPTAKWKPIYHATLTDNSEQILDFTVYAVVDNTSGLIWPGDATTKRLKLGTTPANKPIAVEISAEIKAETTRLIIDAVKVAKQGVKQSFEVKAASFTPTEVKIFPTRLLALNGDPLVAGSPTPVPLKDLPEGTVEFGSQMPGNTIGSLSSATFVGIKKPTEIGFLSSTSISRAAPENTTKLDRICKGTVSYQLARARKYTREGKGPAVAVNIPLDGGWTGDQKLTFPETTNDNVVKEVVFHKNTSQSLLLDPKGDPKQIGELSTAIANLLKSKLVPAESDAKNQLEQIQDALSELQKTTNAYGEANTRAAVEAAKLSQDPCKKCTQEAIAAQVAVSSATVKASEEVIKQYIRFVLGCDCECSAKN